MRKSGIKCNYFLWCTPVVCARPDGNAIFLQGQHDAVVKIKYGKEFTSRYAKLVCYNYKLVCESVKLYLKQIAIGRPSEGQYGLEVRYLWLGGGRCLEWRGWGGGFSKTREKLGGGVFLKYSRIEGVNF